MDFYEILEVAYEATGDEIKTSYRKLAMRYHPDRNPGDEEAVVKFKQVSEAYDVLSDNNKKVSYDHRLKKPTHKTPKPTPSQPTPVQIATRFGEGNLMVNLLLTKAQMKRGGKYMVNFHKKDICRLCGGDGSIYISNDWQHPHLVEREILVKCKLCKGTGLDGTKESNVNVVVPSNAFVGMQVTVQGEGEMLSKKTGLLRVVIMEKP